MSLGKQMRHFLVVSICQFDLYDCKVWSIHLAVTSFIHCSSFTCYKLNTFSNSGTYIRDYNLRTWHHGSRVSAVGLLALF